MSQVYRFTDENGQVRLFAEIDPDPAGTPFNGGTITGQTVYTESDPTATPVQFKPATGATAAQTDQIEIFDDAGNLIGYWDAAGALQIVNGGLAAKLRTTYASEVRDSHNVIGWQVRDRGVLATTFTTAIGLSTVVITSGALPTVSPASGNAFQCSTERDVFLCVPFTGDGTNNAATLKIELSPDNSTYSILDTLSIAAALNLSGALNTPVTLAVPAAWYVKLTATHGTIGTGTYY